MALLCCIGSLAAACAKSPPPERDGAAPRVISLSPAISRMLVDLGLGERVVGRTPFCRDLDQRIPVVGSLNDVDLERVLRLEPTHILIQPPARGADPALLELARREGVRVAQWRISSLSDVRVALAELPAAVLRGPARDAAEARARDMLLRLQRALEPGGLARWTGATALVDPGQPLLAHGRATYLGEVLEALGADNALAQPGWTEISLEDLVRLDPPSIVLVCEACPDGTTALQMAGPIARLDLAAVREGRLRLLCHRDVNLPGSGLLDVIPALRRVLEELAAP
jgi:vitamin B12 transport system substrate-binding protein